MVEGILETVDQLIIVRCIMASNTKRIMPLLFMIAKMPMINCTTIGCCVCMNGKASWKK